jgi:CO/xanthine dehydrogenase FAD-binding subunit
VPYPRFLKPRSLAEALGQLAMTSDCRPLAGGTDLLVTLHAGQSHPGALIDIWSLDELKGVREVDGAIEVGAAESYTHIIESPLVNRHAPALAEAARTIGAAQIQNRGTLGGNLGTASPAGDTLPVMLAADATILTSRRTIPASDFFVGYRTTALEPDELIVAIRFPRDGRRIRFRKVGTRQAQAISKVVMAVSLEPARVAIGSVAEVPLRALAAEAALADGDLERAVEAVGSDVRPIDDVRSTATYRRQVTQNVLRRLLSEGAS